MIGITYNAGNGSSTFGVPDCRGRTIIGVGQGTGLTSRGLSTNVGAETHQLSTNELAQHNHSASDSGHTHSGRTGNDSPDHVHAFGRNMGSWGSYGMLDSGTASSSGYPYTGGANTRHQHDFSTSYGYANISVGYAGGNSAHNNMQPSIALNYIIKT